MPQVTKFNSVLFADDSKVIGNAYCPEHIQTDIDCLSRWSEIWQMKFNVEKCGVLHIGESNPQHGYTLNGIQLKSVQKEKDLRVTWSAGKSLFDDHIREGIGKAKRMIACIVSRKHEVLVPLYKAFVRPHLEYCVQVWSPVAKHGNWGIIMAIEKCQMDFTRIIHGMGFLSYSERLQKLGLTTLLERRMRGDLIEAYKIINGHVNYGHQMFNHNLHYSTRNLCNVSFCRTRFALDSFSVRVIKYWNNLPNSVKYAPSVNAFKTGLDYLKSYNPDSRHGYWYLSQEIFNRIPDKNDHVTYLKSHPEVAMRRHISCF